MGMACATPRRLVAALEALPYRQGDVELVHFLTGGAVAHDASGQCTSAYRHCSFFSRQRCARGRAAGAVRVRADFRRRAWRAAVARARLVLVEVNSAMPRSMGDSALHISEIDHLVAVEPHAIEYHHPEVAGEVVASFAMGSRRLYDLIDRNPLFVFQPIDLVCDPAVLAAQHKLVSVTQACAFDLTGQP